jgi:hybrid cluster-associated redox disulfide protein
MRKDAQPNADMAVDEVMRRWPSTIRAFLDFRMRCVGCPIAAFHSVDEACEEHDIDADVFLPKILETAKAAT